ncbi:NAD(P)-dependent oxidoreductase [Massilia sp. Se16.2.3]|uniref:NAD(P)-dependent oxidoreductase n=1 Tax=Massilia sp. Se16.2.3 TaxID=2709303 RepID=UPI001603B20B|nr:NAD(P)-dependent oxidoreductase [Massilia sp. Se16.2.3]QNA98415.1 NAD(P)-dependent oxidoreductase [Massilia sp. Se16.2.3]
MTLPVVAFLGIGLMGRPMALRLAAAGFAPRVWNRSPAKAAALAGSGAVPCADLGQAVTGAAVVVSMLEAGPAVGATIAAALPSPAPGALWIDMSSTRHDEALAFHARLDGHGMRFLDAPVSGGVAGAEGGTLAIMAGGSLHDFNEALPLFGALGSARLVNPAGSGQVAKLCNQLIVGATIHIVAEALLLAQAAGADPAAVREAIRGGFAGSRILDLHGQRMLERNFVAGGQVKSQLKDLHNVLAAAAEAGLALPLTAAATRSYESIADELGGADHAAVLLALERINPGQRLGGGADQLA